MSREPLKFVLTRAVTRQECDWLAEDMHAGAVVFECIRHAYGCITPSGTACTLQNDGGYPFFELPTAALEVASQVPPGGYP